MSFSLKKVLLTGTALVAVASFSTPAHALARVLTANGTWASSGTCNAATSAIADACANDAVDITAGGAVTLTVTNDATANDGSGVNTFNLGAVTNTGAGTGALSVLNGGNNALTVTIASSNVKGNTTFTNTNAANSQNTSGVTGALTVGGALAVTNANATGNKAVAVTVGGAVTVTGATTITANVGAGGGANSTLTIGGNATFTGGVTMDDNTGTTTLTFNGSSAQDVTGTIIGASGNEGALVVSNTSAGGVTFNSALGGTQLKSLLVSNNGNNVSATFKATTNIAAMTMGNGAGTDTNTVTFDGTFTVTGTLQGDGAANDTNNVVIKTGTITTASAWGGGGNAIDTLTVTGSSAALTAGAAITATNFTLASGGTINTGAQTLTGDINGTGTVVATGNGTVTGNIGNSTKITGVTINTGNTLTVSGDVKATTTTLVGAGSTLALTAAAHTVDSAVVASSNGNGAITIADGNATTTVTGNIGTSTAKLASLAIAGNGGNTLTTTGNLYVNAITTGGASDTLQFLGTSAQTFSGTYQTGVLTVGNGVATSDVTFSGILGGGTPLASINVTTAAKATFNDNVTTSGAFTATGTTTIAAGKTLATASVADGSVGTYNIGVNRVAGGAMQIAKITESGDTANYANDTINFQVAAGSAALTTGTIASVFTGNAGANITGTTVTDDSYLYNLTPVVNGNNIDVSVTFGNTINNTGTTSGNKNVGNVLLTTLVNSTNADINSLQDKLANATTAAAVNEILESAQPTIDGSTVTAMIDAAGAAQSISETRMAAARSGDGLTGMAAGAEANGVSLWLQGFGTAAQQDTRGGIDGYDADTFGGSIGIDSGDIISGGIIGVSFNYGKTDADSKNANTTATDIDSYGVNLYTSHDLGSQIFLNGQLGYAYNNIETARHNSTGPGSGTTAKGDTNSDQISAKVAIGRDYSTDYGMTVTPTLSAAYTHLNTDGYTETGAGALRVGDDKLNNLKLGFGLDTVWNLKNSDGSAMKPMIRVGYGYNAINDAVEISSSFVGDAAATAFASKGAKPARSNFNAGVGLAYVTVADWDLSANYDYTFRTDYDAHSGTIRATSRF